MVNQQMKEDVKLLITHVIYNELELNTIEQEIISQGIKSKAIDIILKIWPQQIQLY